MELHNKSFKVGAGEGTSVIFICCLRSDKVGCYEFFKGITSLLSKVKMLQQQKKRLKYKAKTRSAAQSEYLFFFLVIFYQW